MSHEASRQLSAAQAQAKLRKGGPRNHKQGQVPLCYPRQSGLEFHPSFGRR